jgi:hypothetical protein
MPSLNHLKVEMYQISSDQLDQLHLDHQAQVLQLQLKVNQLKQKPHKNNKKRLLHHHKNNKKWIWEDFSIDFDFCINSF